MAPPSIFVGPGGLMVDYPAYLVQFDLTGSPDFSGPVAFFIINGNSTEDTAFNNGGLGTPSDADLISTVTDFLSGGFAGGTVSDITVTKYEETSSDVTP